MLCCMNRSGLLVFGSQFFHTIFRRVLFTVDVYAWIACCQCLFFVSLFVHPGNVSENFSSCQVLVFFGFFLRVLGSASTPYISLSCFKRDRSGSNRHTRIPHPYICLVVPFLCLFLLACRCHFRFCLPTRLGRASVSFCSLCFVGCVLAPSVFWILLGVVPLSSARASDLCWTVDGLGCLVSCFCVIFVSPFCCCGPGCLLELLPRVVMEGSRVFSPAPLPE